MGPDGPHGRAEDEQALRPAVGIELIPGLQRRLECLTGDGQRVFRPDAPSDERVNGIDMVVIEACGRRTCQRHPTTLPNLDRFVVSG